jgi:hypothetical protein
MLGLGQSWAASDLPSSFSAGSAPSAPWVHRDSGFSFPAEVAGFKRGRAIQYDGSGQDVSVAYDYLDPRIVVTFYVYPLGGLTLDQEFLRRQAEVKTVSPTAKLVSTGTTKVTPQGSPALIGTFSIPDSFIDGQLAKSLLLVSQRGDRFIEYRISYPAAGGEKADHLAQRFLSDFSWPKP